MLLSFWLVYTYHPFLWSVTYVPFKTKGVPWIEDKTGFWDPENVFLSPE